MLYSPAFTFSSVYSLGFGFLAGLRLGALRQFKPFWPLALVQQALPAIILAALRRSRGPALFHGPRTSSRLGAPFWPSGLTLRSSGLAFSQPLTLAVSLKIVPFSMKLFDRLSYALISSFFGAILGTIGWWLYGEAHSLNYDGPAMHPVLQHWLQYSVAAFATLGFILRDHAGEVVGDVFSAIFNFEINSTPEQNVRILGSLVFIAICVAAIWFTTPLKHQ